MKVQNIYGIKCIISTCCENIRSALCSSLHVVTCSVTSWCHLGKKRRKKKKSYEVLHHHQTLCAVLVTTPQEGYYKPGKTTKAGKLSGVGTISLCGMVPLYGNLKDKKCYLGETWLRFIKLCRVWRKWIQIFTFSHISGTHTCFHSMKLKRRYFFTKGLN